MPRPSILGNAPPTRGVPARAGWGGTGQGLATIETSSSSKLLALVPSAAIIETSSSSRSSSSNRRSSSSSANRESNIYISRDSSI